MRAKKVLFPTDFSTHSDAALEHAASLAREDGGKLLILHVEEPPAVYGAGEMYYGIPEPDTDQLERMLHAIVPAESQVAYEHRLVIGDPATEIVRVAQEEGVDMIVMSTHGRTGLRRLLMGSVAEAVVRRAPCAVLTLKATADAKCRA